MSGVYRSSVYQNLISINKILEIVFESLEIRTSEKLNQLEATFIETKYTGDKQEQTRVTGQGIDRSQ